MATKDLLELTLQCVKEEREDRWVVKCLDLGLVVYGKSEQDAEQSFSTAVDALINAVSTSRPRLQSYLNSKGVQYTLTSYPDTARSSGVNFTKRLEVPIGATA